MNKDEYRRTLGDIMGNSGRKAARENIKKIINNEN